ncbi:hypothetical protein SAMN04489761_2499 [Tenacibaculum sp. MAR_2009_124]|uniref:hypothetical protein n=1 Tax=Tenacibaculum sp. MAR_2009_124 TaxID=1250059 RepID=UPI000898BCA3|nr:hypothetical protein [Tenacibaculum sp. MAR_2009_124]SEC25527.1 hypothetical protein SAMN04489761_2499 [Tenacibaculum sp. MAR_2009_124]
MNIPKTLEEFQDEFYKSIDLIDQIGDLRIRQFIQRLNNVSNDIVVSSVLYVIGNNQRPLTEHIDQKYAGIILNEYCPKTELDVVTVLKSTLQNWNKSIEEFPFWIRENYGIEIVRNGLIEFEKSNLNEIEKDKLQTIKWWLRIL